MAKRDYYDILGVSRTAPADEIRKAYRKLVRQYHPDANRDNPQAEQKFREVQEAYDVLNDPAKRRNYDQFGHAGAHAADPFEHARRTQRGAPRARHWQAGPNVHVEDFDAGDFADIFEQFFGGRTAGARAGRTRATRPQPPPGADVEHPVSLTFEQAARGTTLPLEIRHNGQTESIEVKIPPGVKDGSRVRIRGRGENGGDLYIITRVLPHPHFRREDLDIYLDLPVSLYEAMLGAKVEVPTLDGPVTLTIPPGSSGGARLRIRERGVERGGKRGDQFVTLKIIVPKNLDDDDRRVIEALARKHPIHPRQNAPG